MTALIILACSIISAYLCGYAATPLVEFMLSGVDRIVRRSHVDGWSGSQLIVFSQQPVRPNRVPVTFGCEAVFATALLVSISTVVVHPVPLSVSTVHADA